MKSAEIDKIQKMKDRLNQRSPSLCLAKWKQVSILLQNGTTHSCAHPTPHAIPLAEIKLDPSALHNTHFKKQQRQKMLQGQRPSECQYCWNIEDSGEHFSDRHMKSSEFWARETFEEVISSPWEQNVNPSYLEVSFSSACQFKCAYCFPQVSSKWMREIEEHGPYKLSLFETYHDLNYLKSAQLMPIEDENNNPYIKAFWDWMPQMYPELKMLRVTGGEPLLSANTFKILDWVRSHPRHDLALAINTNLGVSDLVLQSFVSKVSGLVPEKMISGLDIFTSVDTSGEQAEYIRHGLKYSKFLDNIKKLLTELPGVRVGVMCTYNALSVTGFRGLLKDILKLRAEFPLPHMWRLWLDIGYVRYPDWMSVQILSEEFIAIMVADLEFMRAHRADYTQGEIGFYDVEIEKMHRLISWAQSKVDAQVLQKNRRRFITFFKEQDRRRGTHMDQTFPEYKSFFERC